MIRWLSMAALVMTAVSLNAQEQKAEPAFFPHNIGVGAGFSTGLGLSYRHWFKNAYGLQINLIPFINNTKEYQNRFISGGLTGLKILKQARVANLFGYIGVHGLYTDFTFTEIDDRVTPPDTTITREKNTTCYIGLGPGIDLHFWKLSINLMAGIAAHFNDKYEWGLQMSGETALYYTF